LLPLGFHLVMSGGFEIIYFYERREMCFRIALGERLVSLIRGSRNSLKLFMVCAEDSL